MIQLSASENAYSPTIDLVSIRSFETGERWLLLAPLGLPNSE